MLLDVDFNLGEMFCDVLNGKSAMHVKCYDAYLM